MNRIVINRHRKGKNDPSAYWEARFDPPKETNSPCEIRIRVYDEAGMNTFYREEVGRRGAFAVATDDWIPFPLNALFDEERLLYDAIRVRSSSSSGVSSP